MKSNGNMHGALAIKIILLVLLGFFGDVVHVGKTGW